MIAHDILWQKSRLEIENDTSWRRSIGADPMQLHWRKGTLHATCKYDDTVCKIHEDNDDPYNFPVGTMSHLWKWNKLGTISVGVIVFCALGGILGIGVFALYALDRIFNHGKLGRKVTNYWKRFYIV